MGNLHKSSREVFGPGQSKLSVKGVIKGNLKTGNGKVTRNLHHGKPKRTVARTTSH